MGQGTRLGNPEEQQRNLTAIRNWSLRQTGDATATSQFTEMDPDSRGIKASSSLTNDDDCMYATISIYTLSFPHYFKYSCLDMVNAAAMNCLKVQMHVSSF